MLFDLNQHGVLEVAGPDAMTLLQGQITNDLNKLQQGTFCTAALCNPKGRVLSLFYVGKHKDHYLLIMQKSMVPITVTALKKYAIFYKVTVADLSDQYQVVGSSNELLPPSSILFSLPALFARYIGIVKKSEQIQTDGDETSWKKLNFKIGLATLYPKTQSLFLPHELNLPNLGAIDFEKGCYTGQEIIARMHYRGKLKSQLIQTTISSKIVPSISDEIVNSNMQLCATIVDLYQSDEQQYELLLLSKQTLSDACYYINNQLNNKVFINHANTITHSHRSD